MRESFGGAFMIKLVLVFIVIYVSFMAVAINYARAFRVKNNVINIIEQNQYDGSLSDPTIGLVDDYLSSTGYNYGNSNDLRSDCVQDNGGTFTEYGACIIPKGTTTDRYYQVTTYIYIEFPFFNIYMAIPISGETKIISNYS